MSHRTPYPRPKSVWPIRVLGHGPHPGLTRGRAGGGGGRLQSRSKIDSFIIDRTFGESCDVHPDVEATEVAEIVYGRFEIQGPPSPSPTGLDDRACSQYDVVGMDSKDVYGWTRLKGDTNCYFINSNSNLGRFIQDNDSLTCLRYKMACKQAMKNPGRGFVEKNVSNEVNKIIFTAKLPHLFALNFVISEDFSDIFFNFHRIHRSHTKQLPYTVSNSSPPACEKLLIPLLHRGLTSAIFLVNLNQIQ